MDIPDGTRRELHKIEKRILELERSSGLGYEELLSALKERHEQRVTSVPVSVFRSGKLAALEAAVKYLVEDTGLSYRQAAEKLGRNPAPIAITYRNARRKMPERLDTSSEQRIPLSVFRERTLSVLECIAWFLKKQGRTYHDIATLLRRDDRTIWTVCARARRKLGA